MPAGQTSGSRGGLRSRWRSSRRESAWGDSLAPLIDVLFLLLFFMLVTARYDRHQVLDVDLPEARSARVAPEVKPAQLRVLTVHADGSLAWNGRPLDLADLTVTLLGLAPEERLLPIFVQADAKASLGRGVQVLDRLRSLGFQNTVLEVRAPPHGTPTDASEAGRQ